jgi:pilus assembly protein CpaB
MSTRLSMSGLPIRAGQLYMIVAIILAVVCGVMFKNLMTADKAASTEKTEKAVLTTPVVVATAALGVGQTLHPEDLKVVDWPKTLMPQATPFDKTNSLVGRVTQSEVLPGEPILAEKLAPMDATGGLALLIPDGKRGITVAVSEIKGVAGFIKPGAHVDVLATFEANIQGEKNEHVTKTVLQDVLVVAAAQEMMREKPLASVEETGESEKDKPSEDKKEKLTGDVKIVSSVTLALSPLEAQKLALAEETGSIRLVLRRDTDKQTVQVPSVTRGELLGTRFLNAPPPPELATVHGQRTVELIQGADKTTLSF